MIVFVTNDFSEREVRLLHSLSIDGAEVVAHGDDVIAGFAPLSAQRERLLPVGVVSCIVIGNQHESG